VTKSERARARRLKTFFNITPEEYDVVFTFQGCVCAICKKPPKDGRRLAVDHDHKSGLIRGLLCNWCNRALAKFRDDLNKFRNTVVYFEAPPATSALGAPRYGLKGRVTNKAKTRARLNRPQVSN